MAVKVKITPFERTIKLVVDGRLSPQARSERIAAFARDEIAAADEQNRRAFGTVPAKTVTVDGREGAPLESVNPDRGVIIAEWQMIGQVIAWIAATLAARSPVLSGRYQKSHTLYADGTEVLASEDVPPASEYIFLNPLPYSRKIEFGQTKSGRPFVVQVENRIYERTAVDAQARFGNLAKIRFTYAAAVGGAIARKHKSDGRVPAISVTLR
jgi:hypothetical protein